MSKIGRNPISIGKAKVEVEGNEVRYSGPKGSGVHHVSSLLTVDFVGDSITLGVDSSKKVPSDVNRVWGLHRALLANKIKGVDVGFEKRIEIVGLGYKAVKSGEKIVFHLGYSHPIDFVLPQDVALDIDKTGQKLTFSSHDKELVGHVCSQVRALRPPEPYKGTGVKLATEVIRRKAGKTKSS